MNEYFFDLYCICDFQQMDWQIISPDVLQIFLFHVYDNLRMKWYYNYYDFFNCKFSFVYNFLSQVLHNVFYKVRKIFIIVCYCCKDYCHHNLSVFNSDLSNCFVTLTRVLVRNCNYITFNFMVICTSYIFRNDFHFTKYVFSFAVLWNF